MINFADITPYIQLLKEKEASYVLKSLNDSMLDEMIGRLKLSVKNSKQLLKYQTLMGQRKLAENIYANSQIALLRTYNLLKPNIDDSHFEPEYSVGYVQQTIQEIVELMNMAQEDNPIIISYETLGDKLCPLAFDKMRL